MKIIQEIKGNVARNCHPIGLKQTVLDQIQHIESVGSIYGPKKVLIIGASSGYGLAARIALAFGGGADTIGVSYEKAPGEKGIGTAGWYNNVYLKEYAEARGLTAKNFNLDAFSDSTRKDVADFIKEVFGGKIDLLVYSVATGVRVAPDGTKYTSTLGVQEKPFSGPGFCLENQVLSEQTLEPVTEKQLHDTVKVMGGEDWQLWVNFLAQAGVLSDNFKTVAFSYIGPESTYPLYKEGSLGAAKAHLHTTADVLNEQLRATGGSAYIAVCKALVTKASAYIPVFPLYITLLYRVMKQKRIHETCIGQMHRLMFSYLYPTTGDVNTDDRRLIRLDDLELRPDVQAEVERLRQLVTPQNFKQIGDFSGYVAEFSALNGFGLAGIDYTKDIPQEYIDKLLLPD